MIQVFAFVGPSGSGKSHRASAVAYEHNVDCVIDDGLLIQVRGSKILAGSSAKREPTMVAAIRRALFADDDHAAAVKRALREANPARVLILGTSNAMVDRIAEALGLPHPDPVIHIEDIATPQEIRRARRIRRELGKHVIPAPTFEVKKSFSGYLIDPLRLFLRKKTDDDAELVEKSVVRPTYSSLGRFFIYDRVVTAIAQRAAEEVAGVVRVVNATIETRTAGVELHLELALRYGVVIMPILQDVQARVRQQVEYMTALNVLAVDVDLRRVEL